MKIIPFILIFVLVGCGRGKAPESQSTRTSRQIEKWVPDGKDLASAQQIMEQHHFICSTMSYTNADGMTHDAASIYWSQGIVRDGETEIVTNITILICQDTDTNNKAKKCVARLPVVNGKTAGPLTVSTYDF